MKMRIAGLVVAAICLMGCVPSLHELYTEETLIYDPNLVGTWTEKDSTWTFEGHAENKSYAILVTEKNEGKTEESRLEGRLVTLDGKQYLDILPQKEVDLNVGMWFKAGLLRAHLFLKMEIRDDTLQLAIMKLETISELLEKDPAAIKHEKSDDRIVLTASPKELQEFVKKNAAMEGFFDKPGELKRQEESPAEK